MDSLIGFMFSNQDENQDYYNPDSPEETIKYVFLEKIKYIEERLGRLVSKVDNLEEENRRLRNEVNRSGNSIMNLHNMIKEQSERLKKLQEKLSQSIILEPLGLS